jgi:diguanylate cyclase (GGDEF)-like protein/PAS domain S-box-containing protein
VIGSILEASLKPLSLKEVLEFSLDAILSVPFFSMLKKGAIFIAEESGDTIRLEAQRGLPESLQKKCGLLPFGKCLCGRAALTREIVFAAHLDEEHEHQYEGIQPHGHYCVPILSSNRLLGVINTYIPDGHKRTQDEEKFFSMAADTMAGVIERKRGVEALNKSKERLQTLSKATFEGVSVVKGEMIVDCNNQLAEMLGYKPEDIIGEEYIEFIHPDDRTLVRESVMDRRGDPYELRVICKDGSTKIVEAHGQSETIYGEEYRVTALRDMTKRKEAEADLVRSEERFVQAMKGANDGLWDWDLKTNEVYFSPRWKSMLGYADDELENDFETWERLVEPEDLIGAKRCIDDYLTGKAPKYEVEFRMRHKKGHWVCILARAFAVRSESDGMPLRLVGTHVDITERKQAVESIVHMAYHDSLTGLPNRALLTDHLCLMLAATQRRKILAAVLFIDLDRFKLINDTLGHTRGDEVLKVVASRLQKHTRKSDTIARQGGDEFILLIQDLNRVEDIAKVAENIFSAFKEPFDLGEHNFSITVSMGISIYPNDGEDADTLIKNADIALYAAKDEGRNNYQLYNASMNKSIANRLKLENKLRKALDNEEFLLHYQPQVESTSGEVTGVEALVRWQDPEEGLISPGEFIPVAEDTRLIIPIGAWVLRTACAQNKLWQDEGLKQITMAVNISMHQFTQKDFVSTVDRVLQETDLNPMYLELELTESIIMEDIETAIERLHALKAMGIRLSIDDFGTGYSSLEYLKRMPIDMLKIAQTFVRDITVDPSDYAIAEATIQLAKSLQLEFIAEGVETSEHLKLLNDLQCTRIQGYLFSKPLPSHEIEKCLKKDWRFAVE